MYPTCVSSKLCEFFFSSKNETSFSEKITLQFERLRSQILLKNYRLSQSWRFPWQRSRLSLFAQSDHSEGISQPENHLDKLRVVIKHSMNSQSYHPQFGSETTKGSTPIWTTPNWTTPNWTEGSIVLPPYGLPSFGLPLIGLPSFGLRGQ